MSATHLAPTVAANVRTLRRSITADIAESRLHAAIATLILALLDRIFDALEAMIADWHAGRLPPLPQPARRHASRRPKPPCADSRPTAARTKPPGRRARAGQAQPAANKAPHSAAFRTPLGPAPAPAPRHRPAAPSPRIAPRRATALAIRAHPPPRVENAAWAPQPRHGEFVTISY